MLEQLRIIILLFIDDSYYLFILANVSIDSSFSINSNVIHPLFLKLGVRNDTRAAKSND